MLTDLNTLSKADLGPTPKELRQFGLILGGIIAVLFGIIFPKMTENNFTLLPWVLATVLVITAILSPKLLRTLYKYWMKLGDVLSFINTRIILGVVYYGLFVPCGFIMKLLGKDPMKRQLNPHTTTYRTVCEPNNSSSQSKNMERPY